MINLALVELVGGISWEPEIRGLLTVVLGMAILGGSVWLLLVTNTGTRLGSLIALAGFWGWMFVMGIFWWIYGIGWVGSLPAWEVQDVFADEPGAEVAGISDAFIGNVDDLPDTNCFDGVDSFPPAGGVASVSLDNSTSSLCTPRAIEVLMAFPGPERETVIRELLNPQAENSKIDVIANNLFGMAMTDPESMLNELSSSQRDQVFDEIVRLRMAEIEDNIRASNAALGTDDVRFLSEAPNSLSGLTIQDRVDIAQEAQRLRVDDLSLSGLAAAAPTIVEWGIDEGLIDLNGWNLQTASQSGEAAATADAFLREDLFPEGNFVVLDAFQQGGKDKRTGTGMWDRISHKISSAVQITHPTNYTVVNVQQTLEQAVNPALPPPVDEIDPNEPTYSVVMVRNLGNLRVVPALFTIVSLLLFLATCLVLHWRDLGLREKGLDV
ncbi:MAG: hypothetical protein AAF567_26245 [Actinomycetota bacterium]